MGLTVGAAGVSGSGAAVGTQRTSSTCGTHGGGVPFVRRCRCWRVAVSPPGQDARTPIVGD